eukprot:COSAG05_NODE_16340_length_348_cov_0.823293_1_plen_115_part_11
MLALMYDSQSILLQLAIGPAVAPSHMHAVKLGRRPSMSLRATALNVLNLGDSPPCLELGRRPSVSYRATALASPGYTPVVMCMCALCVNGSMACYSFVSAFLCPCFRPRGGGGGG